MGNVFKRQAIAKSFEWSRILLVLTFAVLWPRQAVSEDTMLHLSYVETQDRILPTPELTNTTVNLQVRLQSGGTVAVIVDRASGLSARGHGHISMRLGGEGERSWRVAGPNQLVNIREYLSYRRAIQVTVSGTSCTARIGYLLKPGYHDYQYHRLLNNERATARSVSASNITCSIQ